MSNAIETFQISSDSAEAYEARFVPRLFAKWAHHLVEAAGVSAGHHVLDVACGTGIVARTAAERVRGQGQVVGLDLNPNMLAVAQRLRPEIEWRQGDAVRLPFADRVFDRVLCQAALMFFPDPEAALREMARVVTADGTVGVQVWGGLESQPAYGPFGEIAARHAGPDAIALLGAYWSMGDLERIATLFRAVGLETTAISTRLETARFDSIDAMVETEVATTPLGERISAEVYGRILEDTRAALESFCTADGQVELPLQGHLITARKREA